MMTKKNDDNAAITSSVFGVNSTVKPIVLSHSKVSKYIEEITLNAQDLANIVKDFLVKQYENSPTKVRNVVMEEFEIECGMGQGEGYFDNLRVKLSFEKE